MAHVLVDVSIHWKQRFYQYSSITWSCSAGGDVLDESHVQQQGWFQDKNQRCHNLSGDVLQPSYISIVVIIILEMNDMSSNQIVICGSGLWIFGRRISNFKLLQIQEETSLWQSVHRFDRHFDENGKKWTFFVATPVTFLAKFWG